MRSYSTAPCWISFVDTSLVFTLPTSSNFSNWLSIQFLLCLLCLSPGNQSHQRGWPGSASSPTPIKFSSIHWEVHITTKIGSSLDSLWGSIWWQWEEKQNHKTTVPNQHQTTVRHKINLKKKKKKNRQEMFICTIFSKVRKKTLWTVIDVHG